MAQVFSKKANRIPRRLLIALTLKGCAVVAFFWYYGSPNFTDVGYRPKQPVPYSHKLHAGDLGMDCRYCHVGVEKGAVAVVPPTSTCMNCHKIVKPESELLAPIRASYESGTPMGWIRVHKVPDYAHFDHSIHVRAGVGCESCHGNVAKMEVIEQKQPLSMGWCLDCHRNPDEHLRPANLITKMGWTPGEDQKTFAATLKKEKHLAPPEDCSACHR